MNIRSTRPTRTLQRFSVPFVIGVALTALWAPGAAVGGDSDEAPSPGDPQGGVVSLETGSSSTPLSEGDRISNLATLENGRCSITDGISISIGSSADEVGSVTVSFDGTCTLVVEDVSWKAGSVDDSASPIDQDGVTTQPSGGEAESPTAVNSGSSGSQLSLAYDHKHHGWARATVQEQFGVTSTETYASIRYWQDTNVLWNGHNWSDSYCYHSAFPGWDTQECWYETLETTGPGFIANKVHGRYHSTAPPRPTWSLDAKYRATKDNNWNATCDLYNGSLPPTWDLRCNGARSGAY